MKILRYDTPSSDFEKYQDGTIIFLAGPTVRGNQLHLKSWRFEAIELFEKNKFDGTLIIPEFSDLKESDKYRYDLPPWEYEGLKIADCIMFWIPRTKELIGLTTNHEFGFWLAKGFDKMVYGRPEDSYRNKYLDIMYTLVCQEKILNGNICNTLEQTINKAIEKSHLMALRRK